MPPKNAAEPPPIQLLTAAQLAELLGITPTALRVATCRGHVPRGTRIPGLGLRWRRSEIEQWLAEQFERHRPTKPGARR